MSPNDAEEVDSADEAVAKVVRLLNLGFSVILMYAN